MQTPGLSPWASNGILLHANGAALLHRRSSTNRGLVMCSECCLQDILGSQGTSQQVHLRLRSAMQGHTAQQQQRPKVPHQPCGHRSAT